MTHIKECVVHRFMTEILNLWTKQVDKEMTRLVKHTIKSRHKYDGQPGR